jgi:hypothetical protein
MNIETEIWNRSMEKREKFKRNIEKDIWKRNE